MKTIQFIRKRDGRLVKFEKEKISDAIFKAVKAVGGSDKKTTLKITDKVISILETIFKGNNIPTVENVQDLVEKMLIESGHAKVAKAFIIYRDQHARLRETNELFEEAIDMIDNYLGKMTGESTKTQICHIPFKD